MAFSDVAIPVRDARLQRKTGSYPLRVKPTSISHVGWLLRNNPGSDYITPPSFKAGGRLHCPSPTAQRARERNR